MPSVTVATLRATKHSRLVYLSLMTGSVVLNASVSATPTFPASNLAITVNSGSASNVKRGMRVVVETSGGAYKGTLHVRAAGTISSANIPVREVSKGFVAVASGDILKVYDDFPIADKLVAADETFAPDQETYSDQNSNPAPIVSSGGWWAGWKADASAIPFDGTNALNLDPDTANTITWANSTSGGSLSSATNASPTLDLSGTATGRYLLTRAATAVNTKTRTQYVAVRTHDSADPPYVGVEDASMQADPLNGWTYSIRLFDDISSWPDMAPVVVWVDETINGSRQSFGSKVSGRSHIKCAGYVRRTGSGWDENEKRQYVTVEILSPLAALALLPGFSKVMTADATPDRWSEIKTLTVRRAIALLALSYTTLNEAGHDFVFDDDSMTTKLYPQLFLQKIDPLAQLRELALAVDCRVTCDRTGRLEIQHRLELLIDSSRAAVTVTLELTTDDIISYELDREEVETVETFRTRGFVAAATVAGTLPLFAHWPGDAPGMGNQSDLQERLICDSASDNYQRCARYGAWANKVYVTAAGVKKRAPKLTVTLPGTYDCVDLYREFIGVTFTGNLRGVSPSDFKWLVESISTEWDRGTGRVTLNLVAATHGIVDEAEADDTPPGEADNPFPPFIPPPFVPLPVTPPIGPILLYKGTQRIAIIGENGVALTTNFGSGAATTWTTTLWASISSGAISGRAIQWVPNGFSNPAAGWVVTNTKIGYLSIAALTAVLKHTFAATTLFRSADASFGFENRFVVRSYHEGVGIRTTFTTDNSTFTEELSNSNYLSNNNIGVYPGCFVSSRTAGRVLSSGHTNIGNGTTPTSTSEGKVSSDTGDTFTTLSSPSFVSSVYLAQHIHVPWATGNESTVFYGVGIDIVNNNNARLYRNSTDISPVSTTTYGPRGSRDGMQTYVGNANRMLACLQNNSGIYAVWLTDNALAASPSWTALELVSGYQRVAIAGDNGATFYFWGTGGIGLSVDSGATIVSQTGDLNLVTLGPPIGLAGY